jgi:hypothetical protein
MSFRSQPRYDEGDSLTKTAGEFVAALGKSPNLRLSADPASDSKARSTVRKLDGGVWE